jgi:hypothetical protein
MSAAYGVEVRLPARCRMADFHPLQTSRAKLFNALVRGVSGGA